MPQAFQYIIHHIQHNLMVFNKNIFLHPVLRYLIFSATVLLATACHSDVFHNESVHLKNSEWKAADTLFYTFNSKDTLAFYDFYFEVRNTTDYDMQNLYLFITAISRESRNC